MPADYEAVRDLCIAQKKKKNGKISKKDISDCKKRAAIWYWNKYHKPVKHDASVAIRDIRIPADDLMDILNSSDNFVIGYKFVPQDKDVLEVDYEKASLRTYFSATNIVVSDKMSDVLDANEISDYESAIARVVDETQEELIIDEYVPKSDELKQKDLMYISFKLVHVGPNKNKDFFTEEELIASQFTPQFKPLDWEHGEPVIGHIYLSKYIPGTSDEPGYIKCAAVVYKWKYQDYARQIVDKYNNDELFFSMETWFKKYECSTCHAVYDYQDYDLCSHLTGRFMDGSNTYRILRENTFAGAGVVGDPADELADSISIASITEQHTSCLQTMHDDEEVKEVCDAMAGDVVKKEIFYTEEQVNSLIQAKVSVLDADLSTATEKIAELELKLTELASKHDALIAELEAKQAQIASTETEFNALKEEYATYKNAIETQKRLDVRLSDITSLGFTLPVDQVEADKFIEKLCKADDDSFELIKQAIVMSIKKDIVTNIDNENKDSNTDNTSASIEENEVMSADDKSDECNSNVPIGATESASAHNDPIKKTCDLILNILK